MRRLDKALHDARTLRVARALRAKGIESGLGPRTEWMQETLAGQALVNALRMPGQAGEPPSLDMAILGPFVARARDALCAVFAEVDPAGVVAEHLAAGSKRFCQDQVEDLGAEDPGAKDPGAEDPGAEDPGTEGDKTNLSKGQTRAARDHARFFRASARDLGMLAAEAALFEVVRGVIHANDLARETRVRSDRAKVQVRNGRIRRLRARETEADLEALAAIEVVDAEA